jgi:hypothetical protein
MATAIIDVREKATASTARETLRAAAHAVDEKRTTAKRAQAAAERAASNVERARTALEVFRNLDGEADTFRRDAIRAGKSGSLPAALRQKQQERGEAKAELDGALRASADLVKERDTAFAELERAQADVDHAAAGVVLARGREAAYELAELNRRRHVLRLLLGELTMAIRLPMGTSAVAAAVADEPPQLPMDQSPRHRAADYWRRQAARLAADPDSTLEALPDKKALWGY